MEPNADVDADVEAKFFSSNSNAPTADFSAVFIISIALIDSPDCIFCSAGAENFSILNKFLFIFYLLIFFLKI
jgi:hypothetical protein